MRTLHFSRGCDRPCLHYADSAIPTRVRFLAVGYLYRNRTIHMSMIGLYFPLQTGYSNASHFLIPACCGCYTRPAVLVPYLRRLTCSHLLRTFPKILPRFLRLVSFCLIL